MSSPNPRKRPAPGAAPAVPLSQMQPSFPYIPDDQMLRWNGGADATGFVDGTAHGTGSYGIVSAPGQFEQPVPTTSNTLARRQMNRALVPAGRAGFDSTADPWSYAGDESALMPQPANGGGLPEQDNVELLEEQAQKAKREAQAKRKQIPPFVQKLSRFVFFFFFFFFEQFIGAALKDGLSDDAY
jgi:heat shock transcription factor, other eukaryote